MFLELPVLNIVTSSYPNKEPHHGTQYVCHELAWKYQPLLKKDIQSPTMLQVSKVYGSLKQFM